MKPVLLIVAVVVAIALYLGVDTMKQSGQGAQRPPPVVGLSQVYSATVAENLEALGTLRAWEAVSITAKTTGKVKAVHFSDNDAVEQGQAIVELDAESEQAALREAEVNYQEDLRLLRHYRALEKTNAVSRTVLDEQRSNVAASEARVAAARAELENFVIAAPFSGLLGVRQVSPGALVTPGTVITTLDDIHRLRLDFTVPERWVSQLRVGQHIEARSIAYPDETFDAEVTSMGTRLDPATRALAIHAEMANKEQRLKPGMLMTLQLTSEERETLLVDEQALQQEGANRYVFVVDADNRVHRQAVETGVRQPGSVEIVSGLAVGQNVITEGTQKVRDGIAVLPKGQDQVTP